MIGTLPTRWLATIWTILVLKNGFKTTSSGGKMRQSINKLREKFDFSLKKNRFL